MAREHDLPLLDSSPPNVVERCLAQDARLLLIGEPGVGKSTLTAALAAELAGRSRPCYGISADPGSPAFGVPGTVGLAQWHEQSWQLRDMEPLCTLDAGRFRLPLIEAVRRLAARAQPATMLIDAPGLVRGVAGAELVTALVDAVVADVVVVVVGRGRVPLRDELLALPVPVWRVAASPLARRPGKQERDQRRTALWDTYLSGADDVDIAPRSLCVLGAPPPRSQPDEWRGRQVALFDGQRLIALGEVAVLGDRELRLRVPPLGGPVNTLLIRDAVRDDRGQLVTAKPPKPSRKGASEAEKSNRTSGALSIQAGQAEAVLINGVMGDPLLHVRLDQSRRSLLFDLGESARLPVAVVHQVSDIFITHAHIDHIGGFMWLLRMRIGTQQPCSLYGPPGLAAHVDGMVRGVLWDRIGDKGPVFLVHELHEGAVLRFRVRAGSGCTPLDAAPVHDGMLLREQGFRVRAAVLDHHGTASIAYAFEPEREWNVRIERLRERGLQPGPWLAELKRRMKGNENAALVRLPDGSEREAASLAAELLRETAPEGLVYATDFADTPGNRRRLVSLARNAGVLFCEASFLQEQRSQAERTGHLTARACGEIASSAQVGRLVPFHFSRRYQDDPEQVYREVRAVFPSIVAPVTGATVGTAAKP